MAERKKTNREEKMNLAFFDLLMQMNKQLDDNDMQACIMDCFMTTEESQKRCRAKCEDCVEDWLNSFPF